jgi:hypothetical protein
MTPFYLLLFFVECGVSYVLQGATSLNAGRNWKNINLPRPCTAGPAASREITKIKI